MKETGTDGFETIDIKEQNIGEADLDRAESVIGSYEGLFNKRARKYRAQDLHLKTLSESDYKALILGEYTFLARPVYFIGDDVFAGNSKKTVEAIKQKLGE